MHVSNLSAVMVHWSDVPSYSNCTVSVRGKPSYALGYWGPARSSEVFLTSQKGILSSCVCCKVKNIYCVLSWLVFISSHVCLSAQLMYRLGIILPPPKHRKSDVLILLHILLHDWPLVVWVSCGRADVNAYWH